MNPISQMDQGLDLRRNWIDGLARVRAAYEPIHMQPIIISA